MPNNGYREHVQSLYATDSPLSEAFSFLAVSMSHTLLKRAHSVKLQPNRGVWQFPCSTLCGQERTVSNCNLIKVFGSFHVAHLGQLCTAPPGLYFQHLNNRKIQWLINSPTNPAALPIPMCTDTSG